MELACTKKLLEYIGIKPEKASAEIDQLFVNTPDGNRQFDRASPTPIPLKSYTLSAAPTPPV